MHAWAINRCDTVHEEFFIQTSYFDVEENAQNDGFEIAPNPTNGNLNLCFGDLQGLVEVEVFNNLGQKVDAFALEVVQGKEMNYLMPNVPDGLYYIVLKSETRKGIRKLLLQR